MIRNRPWLVFALVFGWKVALFVFTAQPVPANDAYFYDGAAIHQLLHGGFYNPSIARAFPYSGHEVFAAYPPLYQLPLLAWMAAFGVSAFSVMALHIFLFGLFLLVLLAIFRRMQTPAWCVNLTGLFLFAFTFHDRPDSLAHLLGALAVYSCVRARRILNGAIVPNCSLWDWRMAFFVVLTFCTSLQIGGIYMLVIVIATFTACRFAGERIPFLPLSFMVIVPVLLALMVRLAWPPLWNGFVEHLRQTPTITGLRTPHWQELAKVIRSAPGVLAVAALLAWSRSKYRDDFASDAEKRHLVLLLAALLPAFLVVAASLSIVTANMVGIAGYLQPLIVGAYLGLIAPMSMGRRWLKFQVLCLAPAILLGSVRAIGMTTWGIACANDVSYSDSVKIVDHELLGQPPGYRVVMSSAFLYAAAYHDDLDVIHSDWVSPPGGDSLISDSRGITALRPQKLILTQYDYYRRYRAVLQRLRSEPSLAEAQVVDCARTPPPDSIKAWQQVVQHISWAPVIVNLRWRDGK